MRKNISENNKIFKTVFEIVDCKYSDDGGAVVCTNIIEFLDILLYIRSRKPGDVAIIRVNADGGQD